MTRNEVNLYCLTYTFVQVALSQNNSVASYVSGEKDRVDRMTSDLSKLLKQVQLLIMLKPVRVRPCAHVSSACSCQVTHLSDRREEVELSANTSLSQGALLLTDITRLQKNIQGRVTGFS